MKLTLERFHSSRNATLGLLWLNGKFECFTLEDVPRPEKIKGETRIPPGTYAIKPRNAGGMIKRYKARFEWHKGMLHLQDVPGFQWIYIHVGNDDIDTEGCILVGSQSDKGKMKIWGSTPAYMRLYRTVYPAAEPNGEGLEIEIIDRDIAPTVVVPEVERERLQS